MGKNTTVCIENRFRITPVRRVLILIFWFASCALPGYSQDQIKPEFWGEVYSSLEAGWGEEDNVVNETFIKEGLHLFKVRDRDIDVYAKGKLVLDTEEYYWNNRWEIGAGTRIRPLSDLGLILFLECNRKHYIDRDNPDSPNPGDSSFYELEGGYAFWQWWGISPWEVEGLNGYIPFSGWREVYSDGIYYSHGDDNIIFTLDYKEGVMLAKQRHMIFDAYVCVEAGADAEGNEWDNYMTIGPGVRVTPFSNLDLKLGMEYFVGRYTRGEFDGTDEDISKFIITLAFWHGW